MTAILSSVRARRLVGSLLLGSMLLQAGPAYAVSSNYAGFVSQLPGVYATPPDVNVMFTLDDSGSMRSDAIPDIPSGNAAGMPTSWYSSALDFTNAQFPGMWRRFWNRDQGRYTYSEYLSAKYYDINNKVARYLRSAAGNPLYYNPDVTYKPWPKWSNDQTANANADPKAVNVSHNNPFDTGFQLDLTVQMTNWDVDGKPFWPAAYFIYTGTAPLPPANPNTPLNVASSFVKREIVAGGTYPQSSTSKRTDCASATVCTYQEELQNFANWLQYYHSRSLMAKGGVAAAFAKQGTNLRVGFGTINTAGTVRRGVAQFTGTNRSNFYRSLYDSYPSGGTPLRLAVDNVGKYFQRSDNGNPWAEDPSNTSTKGTEYSCRRSFHILSTDGFWNGSPATSPASNNNDVFAGNTPQKPAPARTQYTYTDTPPESQDPLVERFTVSPFSDTVNNTLSDAAAYYWKTDLRPDLDNRVVPSGRDPAFWQHLTTFTIGLGISGTGQVKRASDNSTTVPRSEPTSSPFHRFVKDLPTGATGPAWLSTQELRDALIANKTKLVWTTPSADSQSTGDDLIHAAMSGRGRYFSATNPNDLATGLAAALSEVADQPLDLASLAADSAQLRAGGKLYQATFNPNKWYGRLYAFKQNATTGVVNNKPTSSDYVNPDQVWEASNKLPLPSRRNIYTSTGKANTGTPFLWSNLTSTQQSYLNDDPDVLAYLRGDGSKEVANGGSFRDRSRYTVGGVTGGPLGDIVNGSPVKGPDAGGGYDRLPTSDPARAAYTTFRSDNALQSMRSTIFAGANDGMVHAFNTDDGVERFAYVPNAVYNVPRSTAGQLAEKKLLMLSDPAYSHRFTVDGPPNVSDAYVNGSWRSLLVGSMGAGARAVYAIDVTDTDVNTGGFGADKIMGEFSDADSSDMGFVLGYPLVGRMRNGSWAVIFANGYDSASGRAALFIVDLSTGDILRQFTVGTAGNNGLSQPNVVLNSSREIITIYAGDLKGDLWKFDVSDTDASRWNVAFGGTPLFSTSGSGASTQPITVMPEIIAHPSGGAVVIFGTGKLFESTDTSNDASKNVNLAIQSLYGIWDKPGEAMGVTGSRSTVLRKQEALPASSSIGTTTANNPDWAVHRGWYLDLDTGGERANISPQIVNSVAVMVVNKPLVDPCANGGTARIFALDAVTGKSPSGFKPFNKVGNVAIDTAGVITQPLIQYYNGDNVNKATTNRTVNDRGQLNGGRAGGVELGRGSAPCDELLSYTRNDTSLVQMGLQSCSKKARISWRQLK